MERHHASALYLVLGMRVDFAKQKFLFLRNAEKELGFQGKIPTLDLLYYLIENININNMNNPFGHPTEGEIVETVNRDNYVFQYWRTEDGDGDKFVRQTTLNLHHHFLIKYVGLEAVRGKNKPRLGESIRMAENALVRGGLPKLDDLDNLYMQGTTSMTLELIITAMGRLSPSYCAGLERHDFGSGVYCFRGKFHWALSFAFDRCWPSSIADHDNKSGGSNPAVIAFLDPDPEISTDDKIYDVHAQTPIEVSEDDRLWEHLSPEEQEYYPKLIESYIAPDAYMSKFLSKHENQTREGMKNWSLFVKMQRAYNVDRPKAHAFRGILLHPDSTDETNEQNYKHPKPDMDGWMQYCISDQDDLGRKRLFIEFHLDWEEWKKEGDEGNWKAKEEWKCEIELVEKLCRYDEGRDCYI